MVFVLSVLCVTSMRKGEELAQALQGFQNNHQDKAHMLVTNILSLFSTECVCSRQQVQVRPSLCVCICIGVSSFNVQRVLPVGCAYDSKTAMKATEMTTNPSSSVSVGCCFTIVNVCCCSVLKHQRPMLCKFTSACSGVPHSLENEETSIAQLSVVGSVNQTANNCTKF